MVAFGDVDLACFYLDESWATVPDFQQKIMRQLQELVSRHPGYVANICAGGITTIRYGASELPYHGFCPSSPGDVCTFYDRLLVLGDANIYYTLVHELGHRLNWVNVPLFNAFVTTVLCQPGELSNCEPQLPSYACYHDGASSTTEDFAETAAWYTQLVRYDNCPNVSCSCYNRLDDDYPLHYQFAVERIFNE